MNLFSWIILGLITGAVVAIYDSKPSDGGLVSAMILGVVGSLFGGLLANLLLNSSLESFNPLLLLAALGVALIALFSGRFLRR